MKKKKLINSGSSSIITGGASGLGLMFSKYCLQNGISVLIVDKDEKILTEEFRLQFDENMQDKIAVLCGDVSVPKTMESAVEFAMRKWGRLDLVVNNAGMGADGEFQDVPPEEFQRVIDVNFNGVVNGCRAVWPVMRDQKFGKIVNVSSLAGLIPGGLMTSYNASKWAVTGFTLGLRSEAADYGIEVNCFCPGFVETPIHEHSRKWSPYLLHPKNQRKVGQFPNADVCIPAFRRVLIGNPALIVSPFSQKSYWWMFRLFPKGIPLMWTLIIRHLRKTEM